MDRTQATALLQALEAEHGTEVLASLLGASWRREHDANEADFPEDLEGDERNELERAKDALDEESSEWLDAFSFHPAFGEAAGVC